MVCLSCQELAGGSLCARCGSDLRRAPDRWVGGVLVRSAYLHDGAARALIHRLKYEAVVAAAIFLADAIAPLIGDASVLVPVPRTTIRRLRFGVDPAEELAGALSRLTGIPVARVLVPAMAGRVHAGRSRSERSTPKLAVRRPVDPAAVLIDDVVTTGVTIEHAGSALGLDRAVTATSRILVSSLRSNSPTLSK